MGQLWNGQVQGSGRVAAIILGMLAGGWLWFRAGGPAIPESVTAFLIWTYVLLGALIIAALSAGTAVRIIFLRMGYRIRSR